MGIIINIDDAMEKMQLGERITFDSLDFIADRFGNLQPQEPEPLVEEKEQPPPICAFFAGLEDPMDVGPHTPTQHLNRYRRDVFTELSQESDVEATLRL